MFGRSQSHALILCVLILLVTSTHGCPSIASSNATTSFDGGRYDTVSFLTKRGDPDTLPSHYWRLAKTQADVEAFRAKYNLTLVTAQPQDAALLPSWPQALLQYLLINPVINISFGSNGSDISCWDILQYLVLPPCFIAWIISFARIQSVEKATGGWISTLGWGTWLCFAVDIQSSSVLGLPPLVFALFQWCCSLAVIIQRWTGDIGTVAYRISDLHGCSPADGLDFLQAGIRARPYRIIQTTTFCVSTVFLLLGGFSDVKAAVNGGISMVGFAELVYSSVVANRGMPVVVSGNCMLVELSPKLGYLDSNISTSWKALSGFMGF